MWLLRKGFDPKAAIDELTDTARILNTAKPNEPATLSNEQREKCLETMKSLSVWLYNSVYANTNHPYGELYGPNLATVLNTLYTLDPTLQNYFKEHKDCRALESHRKRLQGAHGDLETKYAELLAITESLEETLQHIMHFIPAENQHLREQIEALQTSRKKVNSVAMPANEAPATHNNAELNALRLRYTSLSGLIKEVRAVLECKEGKEIPAIRELVAQARVVDQYNDYLFKIGIYQSTLSLLVQRLERNLGGQHKEITDLLEQLREQSTAISGVQQEVNHQPQQVLGENQHVVNLKQQINELGEQVIQVQNYSSELEQELKKISTDTNLLQENCSELTKQKNSLECRLSDSLQKLEQLRQEAANAAKKVQPQVVANPQASEALSEINQLLGCQKGEEYASISKLKRDAACLVEYDAYLLEVTKYQSTLSELINALESCVGSKEGRIGELLTSLKQQGEQLSNVGQAVANQPVVEGGNNQHVELLKQQINQMQLRINWLTQQAEGLQYSLRDATNKTASIQSQAHTLYNANQALTKESDQLRNDLRTLQQTNEKLQTEISELSAELKQKVLNWESIKKQFTITLKKRSELKSQVQTLEESLTNSQSGSKETLQQLEELRTQIMEKDQTISNLEKQLEDNQQLFEEQHKQLQALEKKALLINTLEGELTALTADRNKLKTQVQTLEESLTNSQSGSKETLQQLEELRAQVEQKDQTISNLTKQIAENEKLLEEADKQDQELSKLRKSGSELFQRFNEQIAQLEEALEQLEEMETLRTKLHSAQKDFAKTSVELGEVKLSSHQYKVELGQSKKELRELQNVLKELKERSSSHAPLLTEVLEALHKCEQTLPGASDAEDTMSLADELACTQHQEEIDDNPEAVVTDIRAALERLTTRIGRLGKEGQSAVRKSAQQLQQANEKIVELEEQLTNETKEKEAAEAKNLQLTQQLKLLKETQTEQVQQLEKNLKSLRTELSTLKQKQRQSALQTNASSDESSEYDRKREEKIARLTTRCSEMEATIKEHKANEEAFTDSVERLRGRTQEMTQEIKKLETSNKQLSEKVAFYEGERHFYEEHTEKLQSEVTKRNSSIRKIEAELEQSNQANLFLIEQIQAYATALQTHNAGNGTAELPEGFKSVPALGNLHEAMRQLFINSHEKKRQSDSDEQ